MEELIISVIFRINFACVLLLAFIIFECAQKVPHD